MNNDLKQRLKTMGAIGWNPIGFEAAERIEQLEAERDELRALIENHRLCEKEPIAWRFDKGSITKLDVWPHGGNWEPLYRKALATEPKP